MRSVMNAAQGLVVHVRTQLFSEVVGWPEIDAGVSIQRTIISLAREQCRLGDVDIDREV